METKKKRVITRMVSVAMVTTVFALAAPGKWDQVNMDGFSYPATNDGTHLFVFDGKLYAQNKDGLFRMEDPVCRAWKELSIPASYYSPLGYLIYRHDANSGQLFISQIGLDLNIASNWKSIASTGLPGGGSLLPWIIFNSQVYAVYYPPSGIFEIWRSQDIGNVVMNWQKVAGNSFGDPTNNVGVDMIAVFNNHIYIGTDTLETMFGNWQGYATGGVEVWESASGNAGSWKQVNIDGFGTSIPYSSSPSGKLYTNQVIGSYAVYKGHLYVGTKGHWGAEVWQYDGTNWMNVTPPGAGPGMVFSEPGRNEDMIVFENELYLAEGYPTAYLSKYDGTKWSIVVSGPNPFHPDNQGLRSLAVLNNTIFVTTLHKPYSGVTKGDQVYGYPYPFLAEFGHWTYSTHDDWIAFGKPDCWCAPYQCDGDADGVTEGATKYRVSTGDLNIVVSNWKKKLGDATLNPCADIDHKDSGLPHKYRVFWGDLDILVRNWKKTDADLPGNCPRPGYPIEYVTATASSSNSTEEGPGKTINGSGLDADDLHSTENTDMWLSSLTGPQPTWIQYEFNRVYKLYEMWVWNHNNFVEPLLGFGLKDVTIEYSLDGANWATLGSTHEFAQASGTPGYAYNTTVDLGGVVAKYVKITANSNWGGVLPQYGLSEVRFFY